MGRYIVRRLLWVVVLMFFISLLVFAIFYLLPTADPATLRAGRQSTPEAIAAIREQLGLDDPWYQQYFNYMKDLVLHFDFGTSFTNDAPVRDLLLDRIPATLFLVVGAALLWLFLGVAIGTLSAVKRGSASDRLAMGTALVFISAPVYWLGLVMLYLFSNDIGKVHIFPGAGSYQDHHGIIDRIPSMILPWIVLAAAFTAIYARLMRGNMIEVLSEDYIRTARAKGLSERKVIFKHALRAAITPIVTLLGLDVGILLGGAILTETVFNIPGIGRYAFNAINLSDLPVIQGTVLFGAFFIVMMSLIVDVLYAFIDPRVRY